MIPPIQVKICGITNPEDAMVAIDAGADALGFNLWPGSKRFTPLDHLARWVPSLTGVLRVAVMVNPTLEGIRAAQPIFDVIQLHGQEAPTLCAHASAYGEIWKAFPLASLPGAGPLESYRADSILLDSAVPGQFGGTGVLIDLDGAASFVQSHAGLKFWLSGGLAPENVASAIGKVRPYGVDVASGVEVAGDPRRKDPSRIRAFIAAAKATPLLHS